MGDLKLVPNVMTVCKSAIFVNGKRGLFYILECYGFGCSYFQNTRFQNTNKIMIKEKELRIGNLVYSNSDIAKVSGIKTGKLTLNIKVFRSNYEFDNNKSIKPITLTEEWLLRFGFEKRVTINHSLQYFIGENPITHDWLFDILWLEGYSEPFYRNGFHKIKFVHQLQNLYYGLTGSELVFSTEP